MLNVAPWRIWLVIIVTIVGLVVASPNFVPQSYRANIPVLKDLKPVNLGLDLQGGAYLLYQVDVKALEKQQLEAAVDDMARVLREAKPRISYTGRGVADGAARLRLVNPADSPRALKLLSDEIATDVQAGGFGRTEKSISFTQTPEGLIEGRFSKTMLEQSTRRAVDQSREVIMRRIDPGGVSETSVQRQGIDRIVVQAPGEQDPETLKRRIGQTARLTFHLVDHNVQPQDAAAGRVPPGTVLMPQDDAREPFVAVKERAILSGDDLNSSNPSFDQQTNEPVVSFKFDGRGARIFGQITLANTGKRFAVVLDGKVITAPNINEPILGGSGQISGNFTPESAKELSDLLNAGALPAPLAIVEQRSVGPGLGQDAIEAGQVSTMIAGVLVLVFMILAYGLLFGGISVIALVVNGILILAAMSLTGAALTLPGVAGLILTLAVALDANVLIYERMRDEAKAGRAPAIAIDAGFSRAIVTILDANVTHLGAALIMMSLAPPGPVKGFAWTLTIGVFTSVFTAVLVTQLLVAWWFRAARPKKLPIQ
ncbi:MAG: protein translocase subunit SecD [Alphaproteobacteria bacterium]|nr:protein translocase subunit SecD [Alphaproteobacteria bacterium]